MKEKIKVTRIFCIWLKICVWCLSFLTFLLFVTGCQTGDMVAALTTEVQSPTAMAVPPTATAVPPTATPEVNNKYPVVIPFMDLETDKLPHSIPQSVEINRPEEISERTTTVFIMGGAGYPAQQYRHVAQLFVDKGYIAALVKLGNSTANRDIRCALAWMAEAGGEYGIDPDRIVGFGHTAGGLRLTQLTLSLTDAGYTQDQAADCPYALPNSDVLKAAASYDPLFAMVEGGSLDTFPSSYAKEMKINVLDVQRITTILNALPEEKWFDNPEFDEMTNTFVLNLPTYWVFAHDRSKYVPPFFFMVSDGDEVLDFEHEVAGFSKHLDQQELDYEIEHLHGIKYGDLMIKESDIAETIVDLADNFYRKVLD